MSLILQRKRYLIENSEQAENRERRINKERRKTNFPK